MGLRAFLTEEEQKRVVEAIGEAERLTSGEVRVHIEPICKLPSSYERAIKIFNELKMYETKERNGVLIYIAFKSKVFAIIGDKGINEAVPDDFWDEEKKLLGEYLKMGNSTEGLCKVINIIGINLAKYFPYQKDDTNELSNEISYRE